jgi:hypothetical protein
MTIQLTPTQQAILAHAHQHTEGKIAWFPENIKGGARQKVIDGLFKRALITYDGKDWFVAAEGYEALGVPRKAPVSAQAIYEVIEAATAAKPRARDNSKQAQVIAMLKRPEGATIEQICEATQWQAHYADVLVMPTCVGNPACVAERVAMKSA